MSTCYMDFFNFSHLLFLDANNRNGHTEGNNKLI